METWEVVLRNDAWCIVWNACNVVANDYKGSGTAQLPNDFQVKVFQLWYSQMSNRQLVCCSPRPITRREIIDTEAKNSISEVKHE